LLLDEAVELGRSCPIPLDQVRERVAQQPLAAGIKATRGEHQGHSQQVLLIHAEPPSGVAAGHLLICLTYNSERVEQASYAGVGSSQILPSWPDLRAATPWRRGQRIKFDPGVPAARHQAHP
jgi:hypothetical protein